jgi:hypothetical protein
MRFVAGVTWRCSKRGLVVSAPGGAPLLVEHERAAALPELLGAAGGRAELAGWLGDRPADHTLVSDLIAERIVADPDAAESEDLGSVGIAVLPKGRVPDVANQDGEQEVPSAMTHRQACAAEPKQKAPVMLLDEVAIVDCCAGVSFYAP